MRTKKRGLSLFITLCLIVGMLPQTAFATEGATIGTSGLCEHHTSHDETCGYVEAAEGTPCTHEHSEDCYEITESCTHTHTADCYPVLDSGVSGNEATPSDAAQPTCGHACSEESGCITEGLNCTHTHDDLCGYIAAVEGHDCHYGCVECTEESETPTTQVCTCEAAEGQAHAKDCALYEAPADSICTCEAAEGQAHAKDCALYEAPADLTCTCETKCAEDAINADCAICSTEGADLSTCTGQEASAAPVCDCGTDDEAIHATTCGVYVAPENPVCYCVEKCTEVNIWCDVCGFDISKCTGANTAALYATTYTLENGTLTITGTGAMEDWSSFNSAPWYGSRASITNVVIENGVTRIGNNAFEYCTRLTSVTIPDSVTSIGDSAFYGCTSLTSVTIPDSVTSIGDFAFYDCTGLTSVTIPDSVESIGNGTFQNCTRLTSVTIPDSVTSIGDSAFYGCTGLTSIDIPDSVESIGNRAFQNCTRLTSVDIPDSMTSIGNAFVGCTSLTTITVGENNTAYCGDDGVLFNKEKTSLVLYPVGKAETEYRIPDSVTSIGDSAFEACTGLTSMDIPDSVTSIGDSAFYDCTGLTSVTIGDSVTSIGSSAFYGCTGLTSVTIPDSVMSIGSSAFRECTGLTSVTIPDSVTSIGSSAFYDCTGLTSVTIGDSVTSIGNSAFRDCWRLTSVTIGDSVMSISSSAFYGCIGLTSVTIPDSVTSIGYRAFEACTGLTSVTAPCKCTVEEQKVFVGETLLYTFGEDVTISTEPHTALADTGSCVCGYNPIKSVTATGDMTSWDYAPDATATLTAEVEPESLSNATYAWKKDNEVISGVNGNTLALTNLDAGEYTYACTVTVDGYWKISEPFTVTVNSIDPTYNSPTATTNLTYNGRERALVTAGAVMVGGTMKYSTTENGTYTETIPTGTSAGNHTVYYMVEGDEPNYNDIAPQPVTVTIAPASPTIAWAANATENAKYTGAAASITPPTVTLVNNESYSGTINYSYTGTSSGSGLPINAGTYTVTASIEAQGNYTGATSTNRLTLTISPKPVTVTAEAKTKKFGEADPALTHTASGLVTGDTLTGALSREVGEDVGTYAIGQGTVTNENNPNYNITYTGENLTITKADALNIPPVTKQFVRTAATTGNVVDIAALLPSDRGETSYTYSVTDDASILVLDADVIDDDGELTFGTNTANDEVTATITVTAAMLNYADTTITVTVELVNKTPVTIEGVTPATGLVYNGTAQQGYTGSPTNAQGYTGGYAFSYADAQGNPLTQAPTDAGSYTVTISVPDSSGTHSGSLTLQFQIAKKQLSWGAGTAVISQAYVPDRVAVMDTSSITPDSVSLSGVLAGDDVGWRGTVQSASFADDSIGTGKPVAVALTGLVLTGADADNYLAPTGTLTLTGDITAPNTGNDEVEVLDGFVVTKDANLPNDASYYGDTAGPALDQKFGTTGKETIHQIEVYMKKAGEDAIAALAGVETGSAKTEVLEISLKYWDGDSWEKIDEEHLHDVLHRYPNGVPVTIPYRLFGFTDTANYSNYKFVVQHMITLPTDDRYAIGDIEDLSGDVTAAADGLHFNVMHGFSPFVVGFAETKTSQGGNTGDNGGNTGTTSGGGTSYGNDNNDNYTAPTYRNHEEDFGDVQVSLKHVDLNTGGGPLEVEAPAIVGTITTPDGKPEITDPRRGLADTTEDAKKGIEKAIPGVVEPEVVAPAPDDATESQSKPGGLFAGIAVLLAALAVGGGYLYFRKRKEAE